MGWLVDSKYVQPWKMLRIKAVQVLHRHILELEQVKHSKKEQVQSKNTCVQFEFTQYVYLTLVTF